MEEKVYWNYEKIVAYDDVTGAAIYYKEGTSDSSATLPTGANATYLADGCKVLHSNTGDVKIYNKKTDTWRTLVTIENAG